MTYELPTFTIHPSAERYINGVSFDAVRYAEYLQQRGVSDEDISLLDLSISKDQQMLGSHASFMARDRKDTTSRHSIEFSPHSLSSDLAKQGKILRHETEHMIYGINHPHLLRNRAVLFGGTLLGASIFTGTGVFQQIHESTHELPPGVSIPIDVVAGIGGAALGLAGGAAIYTLARVTAGPSEISAQIAERTRKGQLPDGTLKIEFK